jgi:type IV pilus assembly protein PilB
VMVGEIRDLETAEIAIKAAQTGHLVLSTLHTNDAPQTLTRLVDMGVKPYAIATSVSLIIAQRLARRLCANCKQPIDVPVEALRKEGFPEEEIAKRFQIYAPKGCSSCTDGYKGRLDINDCAKAEGVWDLRRAGLSKVQGGLTSLEEINSVTID